MTTSLKGIFDEVHDTDGLLGTNKSPRYTTNTSKVFRTKQFGYFLLGLNLVWSLANLSITSQQARSSLSLNRDMRQLSVPCMQTDIFRLVRHAKAQQLLYSTLWTLAPWSRP